MSVKISYWPMKMSHVFHGYSCSFQRQSALLSVTMYFQYHILISFIKTINVHMSILITLLISVNIHRIIIMALGVIFQRLASSSSVPKSTSSMTLPISSPSSHSQFEDVGNTLRAGMPSAAPTQRILATGNGEYY